MKVSNFVIYDSKINPSELGFIVAIYNTIDSISKEEVNSLIYVIKPIDNTQSLRYVKSEDIKQVFEEVLNVNK